MQPEETVFKLLDRHHTLYFGVAPQDVDPPYVVFNSNQQTAADTLTCRAENYHELGLDFYDKSPFEAKRAGLAALSALQSTRPTGVNSQILHDEETGLFYFALRYTVVY